MQRRLKTSCLLVFFLLSACGGGNSNSASIVPTPSEPKNPDSSLINQATSNYIASLSTFVPEVATVISQDTLLAFALGIDEVLNADEQNCIVFGEAGGDPQQPNRLTLSYSFCELANGIIINNGFISATPSAEANTTDISVNALFVVDSVFIRFETDLIVTFLQSDKEEVLTIKTNSLRLTIDDFEENVSAVNIQKAINIEQKNYTYSYSMTVESSRLEGNFSCGSETFYGVVGNRPKDYEITCASENSSVVFDTDSEEQGLINTSFGFIKLPFEYGDFPVSEFAFTFDEVALGMARADLIPNAEFVSFHSQDNFLIYADFGGVSDDLRYFNWRTNEDFSMAMSYGEKFSVAPLDIGYSVISASKDTLLFRKFTSNGELLDSVQEQELSGILNFKNQDKSVFFVQSIEQMGSFFIVTLAIDSEAENTPPVIIVIHKSTFEISDIFESDAFLHNVFVASDTLALGNLDNRFTGMFLPLLLDDGKFQARDPFVPAFFPNCVRAFNKKRGLNFSDGFVSYDATTLEIINGPIYQNFLFECEDVFINTAFNEMSIVTDANNQKRADIYRYHADTFELLNKNEGLLNTELNEVFRVKHAAEDYYLLLSRRGNLIIVGRYSDSVYQ